MDLCLICRVKKDDDQHHFTDSRLLFTSFHHTFKDFTQEFPLHIKEE